jgi:hypothetical protein
MQDDYNLGEDASFLASRLKHALQVVELVDTGLGMLLATPYALINPARAILHGLRKKSSRKNTGNA